ncbi:MAG TPA: CBS domain-containing protein, partial [Gemmatimonadales bacterium]|nr:CBS domain-containing protein [Gemmatimonadales bacterium]
MKVADLMRTDLKTISVDATVEDAVTALVEAGVSALPVVDRYGRAVGVVSARDVLRAESEHGEPRARERLFRKTRVLEIMNPWPLTVAPETEVRQAARDMLKFGVQRLWVERDGVLVGVISQTDIVAALAGGRLAPAQPQGV